jgi:hypothetical protein
MTAPKPDRLARLTAQYGERMAGDMAAILAAPEPSRKSRQPERPDDPLARLEATIAAAFAEYRAAVR